MKGVFFSLCQMQFACHGYLLEKSFYFVPFEERNFSSKILRMSWFFG